MNVQFSYKPELEYERFVNIFRSLVSHLYQDYGFIVLPYRTSHTARSVYIPRIPKFQLDRYSEELKLLKYVDIPLRNPSVKISKMITELKNSYRLLETIDTEWTEKVEGEWGRIQTQFEDYLTELFPRYRRYHFEVQIYWTRYGTSVSFGRAEVVGMNAIIPIHLRDDMGVSQIIEGILSSLFLAEMVDDRKYTWLQRESVIDFVMQNTKLSRLAVDYVPTLEKGVTSSVLEQIYRDSNKYVEELGCLKRSGLSVVGDEVMINDDYPTTRFSHSEAAVLKRLLLVPDKPVSYFELGDLLWKDSPDEFSLWALSRVIYKLRNKLYKNGLSQNHIKNARGEGYLYTRLP